MKKLNKRYKEHDICSVVGTRTIISYLDNYITESIDHLKEIQTECASENFSPENLYLPIILICDASTDVVQHKLDLLKSSLDRYLFADEDFKQSSIKHDKITKTKRLQPPQKLDIQPAAMEVDFGDGSSY